MNNILATSRFEKSKREILNSQRSQEIAEEGIVLLKNNGVLPLQKDTKKIALFGSGARDTIIGGTGSADVNVREKISIEKGLLESNYEIVTNDWLDEYSSFINDAKKKYDAKILEASKQNKFLGLVKKMSNPFTPPVFRTINKQELCEYNANVAIYVLSRSSGEGADRKLEESDYYLSNQEITDILAISNHYKDTILLLNVGGQIHLEPILDSVNAIVLVSQAGINTGFAVSNILCGKMNPSGKLTSTWTRKYDDYPSSSEFGGRNNDIFDSFYREDIYVGYRYFDTFKIDALFPFGFGLSYSKFSITKDNFKVIEENVYLSIDITNIGEHSGKEVIQVYIAVPSKAIPQPNKVLVAFRKTKELKKNETEKIEIVFPLTNISSYSEMDASWVLESGHYGILLGNSSQSLELIGVIDLTENIVVEKCKNLMRSEIFEKISTTDYAFNYDNQSLETISTDLSCVQTRNNKYDYKYIQQCIEIKSKFEDIKVGNVSIQEFVNQLPVIELATLCVGDSRIELANITLVGNESKSIPGAAGETTTQLAGYNIPSITCVDGPSGIRVNPIVYQKNNTYINNPQEDPIFRFLMTDDEKTDLSGTTKKYQYCTALPVATMIAQTWNAELMFSAGKLVAEEMDDLGVSLWLAPAMNIQRNPLCGRNFEYFSEDPLLTGKCAIAITNGVQSVEGKGVTIKHLAANSQETNRNYNNSIVSERALREIYLKGFEMCIKEANPYAVMTSVNLINGIHTASDKNLLTHILRDEWGFKGAVMTDWGTTGTPGNNSGQKYDCNFVVDCMKAGNDLIMPGSIKDIEYIVKAIEENELDINDVRKCAANIIGLLLKTT